MGLQHLIGAASATAILLGATAAGAQTKLTYMMWDPDQLEIEQSAIKEFEAANPGVEIEALAMPPKDYWPRLSALAAAGDLPDVFGMSSGFIQEWQANGQLADLTGFVEELDADAYYGGAMDIARFGDGMYAFPQNWVAPVLYYNKTAFDAAGVAHPDADWTWDEFLEAAKALTTDSNGDGDPEQFGFWAYGRYAHIEPWIYRNGGRLLSDDRTELVPDEAAIEALQFVTDLASVHGVAAQPQEMEGIRQQDVFPQGMAAMWVDGSWNINNTRTVAGDSFEWGIAQVPLGPSATADTAKGYAWADMLAIAPNSEQADLAWAFIRHMVGEGRSPSDFEAGKVPAFRAIAETDEWLERDQQPANKDVILNIGAQTTTTSFTPGWSKWRGYAAAESGGMNGELDEVFNGRKTLDEAVAAFVEYGNGVLSQQ